MSKWKETNLASVAHIDSGFAFKSKEYSEEGELRVVRGKNVTVGSLRWGSDSKFWNLSTDKLKRYLLTKNDIVIGMDGSKIGENRSKIKAKDLPAILAQRVARVRAKSNNSQEFLWQTINSQNFVQYIKSIHTGTSIPHISQKQIGNFEILLPLPHEQKAIAEILSSLDDKIDLLHNQNQTLEAMSEAFFRHWFLKGAEENWKGGVLEDLIEIKYGKDHKKLEDGKIPVLGSGGIMRYADTALYEEESVLIPRKGSLNNVLYMNEPFWTVDTMFYTIMKRPNLAKFIYQFIKIKDLAGMNVGSAVPSMTTTVLNNMPIKIPSDVFLAKFESTVQPFYEKVQSNSNQIKTLENTRDTLLPKLMSGEVKVA